MLSVFLKVTFLPHVTGLEQKVQLSGHPLVHIMAIEGEVIEGYAPRYLSIYSKTRE
jgi:hypothetical protein